MSFEKKPNYKFEDLIEIMKLLRAPNVVLGIRNKLMNQLGKISLKKLMK